MTELDELCERLANAGVKYVRDNFGVKFDYHNDRRTVGEAMDGTLVCSGLRAEHVERMLFSYMPAPMRDGTRPCPLCGRDMTAIESRPGRGELHCGHCDLTIGGDDPKTPEELEALLAQRTCRVTYPSTDEDASRYAGNCTRCGFPWVDVRYETHCGGCGARVVTDDA